MADIVPTASQVVPSTGARFVDYFAAVAINAGQTIYVSNATLQQVSLGDADATAVSANVRAIAINSAAVGQAVRGQYAGRLVLGAAAAPVKGTIYVASDTAGGIKPVADLVAGDWVTVLGVGDTGNILDLGNGISASGIQV